MAPTSTPTSATSTGSTALGGGAGIGPPGEPGAGGEPLPGRGEMAVILSLLPYLRPFLWRIGLSLGLILASKGATLLVPLALKRIVDRLNLEPSLLVLPVAILMAYGAARVSVTLFTETRQVVFARVMARASASRCTPVLT